MKICKHWTADGQQYEVHYPEHEWMICPVCDLSGRMKDLKATYEKETAELKDISTRYADLREQYREECRKDSRP